MADFNFILDLSIPEGEVHFKQGDKLLGKIINIEVENVHQTQTSPKNHQSSFRDRSRTPALTRDPDSNDGIT